MHDIDAAHSKSVFKILATRNSLHVFRARHVCGKLTQLAGQEMSIIETHSLRLVIGDQLTAAVPTIRAAYWLRVTACRVRLQNMLRELRNNGIPVRRRKRTIAEPKSPACIAMY